MCVTFLHESLRAVRNRSNNYTNTHCNSKNCFACWDAIALLGWVLRQRSGIETFQQTFGDASRFTEISLMHLVNRILGRVQEIIVTHEKYRVYAAPRKGLMITSGVGRQLPIARVNVQLLRAGTT